MSKSQNRLWSIEEAKRRVYGAQMLGQRVIFTNGCFDILHRGHVTYLDQAAQEGDLLIVGLNSDESVRRQGKGPERPVVSQEDRAVVLAALRSVAGVVVFDQDTPEELIKELRPDVLVKGGDYDADETDPDSPKYVVGRDTVLSNGGKVICIPLVPGQSTTSILRRANR